MIDFFALTLAISTAIDPAQHREDFAKQMSSLGEPARVLALSCVNHVLNANDLEQFAASNPAFLAHSAEQARPFLQGGLGKSWGVRVSEFSYAISLTDSGICSVYAEKADRARSIPDLKALVTLLYPGGQITRIDGSKHGLGGAETTFDGWTIFDPSRNVTYWYTALVPQLEGARAQTVYSVFVTKSGAP